MPVFVTSPASLLQEGDQKQLKLRFDVSQYKPEEIVVKTVDNKLLVSSVSQEQSLLYSTRHAFGTFYVRAILARLGTPMEAFDSQTVCVIQCGFIMLCNTMQAPQTVSSLVS